MRIILRFRSPGADFVHPLTPAPKTAVLLDGFRDSKGIRVFADGWNPSAARFAPESIAAPLHQLRQLAQSGITVRHSVVVLTRGSAPELCEEDRAYLWDAFGVPVFEQCIGIDNRLLAQECETHDGLHVVTECHGLRLERSPCECGNSAPRVQYTRAKEFTSAA